jgi:hypothetical protein
VFQLPTSCPANSCGHRACTGDLEFGYITATSKYKEKYHTNQAAFKKEFWIFTKDWERLGCKDEGDTFSAYVIDPISKEFQPENPAIGGQILTKCTTAKAGLDPSRLRPQLETSAMTWHGACVLIVRIWLREAVAVAARTCSLEDSIFLLLGWDPTTFLLDVHSLANNSCNAVTIAGRTKAYVGRASRPEAKWGTVLEFRPTDCAR